MEVTKEMSHNNTRNSFINDAISVAQKKKTQNRPTIYVSQ